MARGVRHPGLRAALRVALAALGLAGALLAAPGLGPSGATAEEAVATDPSATDAAPEAAPPYGSSDLDRRRRESVDPDARQATPSAPAFGADAKDPGELRGRSKPLDELARPPAGRSAGPSDEAPESEEDALQRPPPGPAPLRLRRRPDVAAAAERTLGERLCSAERDVAFARRENQDAVAAYKRARRDGYPRGDARALVVEHRELSARRLRRAEAERDALLAEAEAQRFDPADARCRRGL